MIYLKTDEEIEMLRKANLVVAGTLAEVAKWVAPGVTTRRLDQIAEEYIRSLGCTPGFKGLYGFPATLCTSVNEVVVHGIPSNYVLEDGDIVSCDCGAVTPEGFNGDSTYTSVSNTLCPATVSVTSDTPSSNTANATTTVSCARCAGMVSDTSCTRIPKCPTTDDGELDRCCATV